MYYFDNSPLTERINTLAANEPKPSNTVGWLIVSLILVTGTAVFLAYKYYDIKSDKQYSNNVLI